MASYLPSIPVSIPYSWQKRLLLFALDRLDVIDTQGLDLDNLGGLTWGRRSVVELKNVSIKINTLAERANLPPNVVIEHAAVAVLRLTVPADLSAEPIHIEVQGVRITTRLRKDDPSTPGRGADNTPSYKDRANRPRLASPSVHDPGGRSRRDGHALDMSHVIPTSEDLAASFLQSEPRAEREELEALVGNQSQYMTESVSSSSSGTEEDAGLGLQGGFALPSFLTNYFQGIADRLTLQISEIQITIRLELTPLDGSEAEDTTFIFGLDTVHIGSLKRQVEEGASTKPPRRIALRGLHLDLEVDQDVFSHPSSPRLDRQSVKSSSSHLRSSMASEDRDDKSDTTSGSFAPFIRDLEQRPTASRTRTPAFTSLAASDSLSSIEADQLAPSIESSPPASPRADSQQLPTASRLGASSVADQTSPTRRDPGSPLSASGGLDLVDARDELSESALFTHDQAESMYASAMSFTTAPSRYMPGGWANESPTRAMEKSHIEVQQPTLSASSQPTAQSQAESRQAETEPGISSSIISELQPEAIKADLAADTQRESDSEEVSTPIPQHAVPAFIQSTPPMAVPESTSSALRLASLEYINLIISDTKSIDKDVAERPAVPSRPPPHGNQGLSMYSSQLLTSRHGHRSTGDRPEGEAAGANEPAVKIETGQLKVDVDLGICKLLVRVAANVHNMLPTAEPSTPVTQPKEPTVMHQSGLHIKLGEVLFNFHEGRNLLASLGHSDRFTKAEDALLSLSLMGLEYVDEGNLRRRLTISSVKVRHAAQDVLWFVESVNVRESIASSAMMRPHDLTLSMDGERTEIQIKPVRMVVDLLLVDDVLSRGGGLDSLLELGNSIMSTHNTMSPPPKTAARPQQRTVRFNAPGNPRARSGSDSSSGLGKINIRVGGSIIDLVGSEASIQVKTSAIKFVVRPAGARVVIDGAMIEGPILERSKTQPPIYIKVKALEIIYCDTPEETDLDRLLSLITPSNDKFDESDDIMVDTLLKQRRKAGVVRSEASEIQFDIEGLEWQQHIAKLSDELAKLSSVTKYLPEDDRPGLLSFALVKKFDIRFAADKSFGPLTLKADLLEGAHIAMPSLAAAQISSWSLSRGKDDVLIGEVLPQDDTVLGPPMLMCRFIAGEMEPTVRLKLTNTCVEYKVQTLVAITDLVDRLNLGPKGPTKDPVQALSPASSRSSDVADYVRKIKVSIVFRDSAAALYPSGHSAKGLFVMTDTTVGYETHKYGSKVTIDMAKTSLLAVNSVEALSAGVENADDKLYFDQNDQIQELTKHGYVPLASLTSAVAQIKIVEATLAKPQHIDVELDKALLFLETCADSTQTLSQILGGLSPPSAPSKQAQFRTEIVPIENMLASFTGNAFVSEAGPELGMDASRLSLPPRAGREQSTMAGSGMMGSTYEDYDESHDAVGMMDSFAESDMASSMASSLHIAPVDITAPDPDDLGQSVMQHSMLDFREAHFNQQTNVGGTAHRWNSTNNTYEPINEVIEQQSPVRVKVRNLHVIWNLFDGYDWQGTRDTISQAVKNIEEKAMLKRPGNKSPGMEEDEEDVIGDVLFNSIYISIPANKDPRDLTRAINQDIDDMVSETGSYATSTTVTATPSRQARRQSGLRPRPRRLKLNRSKHHKISFELQGLAVDFIAFPPDSSEVQSSVDVRVHKLEIFDHVPTSTWKKFVTYLHDAGEREVGTSMVHVELLNVRPVPALAATEIVMKLTVLPLRLHVDQDALDFMARFFEFKDESVSTPSAPSTPPFIQRVEVNPIRLQLDYKPKKVDYAGLRSGRTTEFMNFLILERANMVLRRVILYGVSGFDRMGIMLNNIWSPDVRRNQLPTVLAGLAPVRPFVDVANGMANLVSVPIREYQKDGRIVRSIQKGAMTFAKTTATELVNLGAKLAIGTQQVLQNTEDMLVAGSQEHDQDDEATRQISLYADQPVGIVQGLRGAYASLERDLLLARDAIVAVPGEAMATGTAAGAAKAVLRQSPTIILRPAIGATKAVGQTLMGAGNTLDKRNLRRIEDKYKRY